MILALESDMSSAQLNVTSTESQEFSTTLNLLAPRHVQRLATVGSDHLLRVVGSPQILFPGADCPCAPLGDGEGEVSSVFIAADDAEGEALLADGTTNAAAQLGFATAVVQSALDPLTPDSINSRVPSFADDGEGEATRLLATPADAYLATDLLMAEPTLVASAHDVIKRPTSAADEDAHSCGPWTRLWRSC